MRYEVGKERCFGHGWKRSSHGGPVGRQGGYTRQLLSHKPIERVQSLTGGETASTSPTETPWMRSAKLDFYRYHLSVQAFLDAGAQHA